MKGHPIFNNMDDIQIDRVIDAMKKADVPANAVCSEQGKSGKKFYSILKGEFLMTSIINENKCVKVKLGPGHSFGEIFLYDTPRLYTVKAETDGVLCIIDRATFRRTLELYEKNKLKERTKFLRDLKLFAPLTSYEISRLAEACVQLYYEDGEYIIKRGERVNDHSYFYVIEKGYVVISACGTAVGKAENEEEKKEITFQQGQYFGERALLTGIII